MKISFLRKINSDGGPKNFQIKFINWLEDKDIQYDFCENFFLKKKIILVNAGSRRLIYLIYQKLIGAKIIQRLDGVYNLNDFENLRLKIKVFLSNLSMNIIRILIADKIIYQSLFVKERWEYKFGKTKKNFKIIHNPSFNKFIPKYNFEKEFNILIMEGNVQNNKKTNQLLKLLFLASKRNKYIKNVFILGNINPEVQEKFKNMKYIKFLGYVPRKKLLQLLNKKKMIYFPVEFNASCPNSYIELISSGIPSCFIEGGSFSELSKFSSVKIKNKSINISLIREIDKALNKVCENYYSFRNLKLLVSWRYDRNYIFNKYIKFILS
jgi:hypothetical protein